MILAQIERWAALRPDALALSSGDRALTYSALRDAISTARDRIERFGASPGLALLDIADMIVAWPWLLALRSLDYTVLPTSPDVAARLLLPPGSLTLALSGRPIDEAARGTLPLAPDARVIDGYAVSDVLKAESGGTRRPLGEATGASLLLSSGTTGRPKIVRFTTEHEVAAIDLYAIGSEIDSDTVWCGGFALTTAAGYRFPLRVWAMGGTVVLNQGPDPMAPFETDGLTLATLTPGMLSEILGYEGRGRFNAGLNIGIVGGAAHWPDVVRAKERLAPVIGALYGSTEAGTLSRTEFTTPDDLRFYTLAPGRIVQIVDEDGSAVAPGSVGIVRTDLRGKVVEYWNDPETTARIFRDGFFYPGDMGRLTEDGRLELVGRTDDVLVWQGDKIAPGPLEREIKGRTGVSEVCLFVEATARGPVLLVVLEGDGPMIETARRRVMTDVVEGLPVRVESVPAMPRNAMGKVQRQMLKAAVMDAADA